jgi:hypothetical protein
MTPSKSRLFLKRTPGNLPLLQSPIKNIQISEIIFAILGMFHKTILLGRIVNQAAHDDKPPVVHHKNVPYDVF